MVSLVRPEELMLRGRPAVGELAIGLLAPLSGLMGIAGPSILNCAVLAAEHIAERSGLVPELVVIDAGAPPASVARVARQLAESGLVDGFVGAHTSDVRRAVAAAVGERVPYVFTPPHERGATSNASIFLGADPRDQLTGPVEWVVRHHRVRRWALIGNDYVWPRQVHRAAGAVLRDLGQTVVMDRLVPINGVDSERLIDEARQAGSDAILVSLVGRDGITFHREAAELGTDQRFVRLCTALDENCLLAAGGDSSGLLYSAMPSFIAQPDERHQTLLALYVERFGASAPLPAAYAEGCYDGVVMMAELRMSGLLDSASPAVAARRLEGARSADRPAGGSSRLAQAVGHELVVVDDPGSV